MKKLIIVVLCLVLASATFAKSWNIKSNASLNLNQSYYSDAWAGGDIGSISWALNFNALAEKQLTDMFYSENTLKLAFGQTHNSYKTINSDGDNEVKWQSPVKSTDLIDFESVLRMTLGSFVDPYVAFRAETHFYDNTVADDTKYLNPLTLTESAGAARVFISTEEQKLSTRLGFGVRQLMNQHNDETPIDGGIISVTDYFAYLFDGKISYNSRLSLYQALFNSESDNLEDWDVLDVNFENTFTASVMDYIDVSLFLQLKYDKQENEDLQFKETLGLGVSYTFAK